MDLDWDDMPSVGSGNLAELHNAPLQVGAFMLLGLGAVIALKALGFRFVVGANIGGGMG